MKVFITIVALLLSLVSCSYGDSEFAMIKGKYTDANPEKNEIHLSKVEHGEPVQVASTRIGKDGYFAFTYAVETPGIYVVNILNSEHKRTVRKDHNLKRFYLEPGTEIELELTDGNYQLIQTNSEKNRLLTAWHAQIDTAFTYAMGFTYHRSTYKDFFPLLPEYIKRAETFKKEVASGDPSFDELIKLMVDNDLFTAAIAILQTPRSEHPTKQDRPAFYQELLTLGRPDSERLLELPGASAYLRLFPMYATMSLEKRPQGTDYIYSNLSFIPNELLKGYHAVSNLSRFRSYDESFIAFKQHVTPYLKNDYLKEKFKAYEISIRKFEEGADAFDFAGKDSKGKEHKLSDFKGTLVYVDVWATWCGPCKKEIPALKILENKLHGKPITFLSISLDKPKDKQKWLDFVKENQMGGVQLIADKAFDSDVAQAYGITGIPRFMLFDKEGKIITTDAPRPSEEKTELWLRSLL